MPPARLRPNPLLPLILAISCLAPTTFGQTSAPAPAFDVITIKPISVGAGSGISGFISYPGGRILLGNANIKMIVQFAYNVQDFQITGEPAWADSEHYDIVALPPDSSPSRTKKQTGYIATPTHEQSEMLQSLLTDRFGFKYHRETRDVPVLYLGVDSGKKLQLHDPANKDADSRGAVVSKQGGIYDGEAFGQNASMPFLTTMLSRNLHRIVIDQTGLTGSYDFKLEPDDPENHDLNTAVFDVVKRLGLTLKPGKGPVDTIVIDSVSRPTGN